MCDENEQWLNLLCNISPSVGRLLQEGSEMPHEVVLQEELKYARVVLISPYHQLRDCSQSLNNAASVLVSDRGVVSQHLVQMLQLLERVFLSRSLQSEQTAPPALSPVRHASRLHR